LKTKSPTARADAARHAVHVLFAFDHARPGDQHQGGRPKSANSIGTGVIPAAPRAAAIRPAPAAPRAVLVRGADEALEQRVRLHRLGFELGMELAAQNHGWSAISQISTYVPSGVSPVIFSPRPSALSYSRLNS
jgi:hypothetical protein